ncbi:VanZ family protein [[Clostridium] polysaccharolyticum]|uniref:VanZ family protein n=1 Tax=[Clostridium] polysaccharolyticum TaxID=29364 RepID=UPI0015A6BA1F|nr:VanZ family protein [[Clostridium] polysaccharolyticum]
MAKIVDMHIRMWSPREILGFGLLLLVVTAFLYRQVRRKTLFLSQAISIWLELLFLGVVFSSTVFTRTESPLQFQLKLFWSWEIAIEGNKEILVEILLNFLLLVPAGVLLPIIFHGTVKPRYGWLIGVTISFNIEILQLILHRGMFEWDDILHNSLGCMFGCIIMNRNYKLKASKKIKSDIKTNT